MGNYHFLWRGVDNLSVMDSRQFFFLNMRGVGNSSLKFEIRSFSMEKVHQDVCSPNFYFQHGGGGAPMFFYLLFFQNSPFTRGSLIIFFARPITFFQCSLFSNAVLFFCFYAPCSLAFPTPCSLAYLAPFSQLHKIPCRGSLIGSHKNALQFLLIFP